MMTGRRNNLLDNQLETLDLRQGVFVNCCVPIEGSTIQDILVNHDTHSYTVLQHGIVSLYQEDRLQAQHHVDSDIIWLLFVTRLNKYAAFTSSTVKVCLSILIIYVVCVYFIHSCLINSFNVLLSQ